MSTWTKIGGVYKHYKGDRYIVITVALESTNGRPREFVVVYAGTKSINVRTEHEFHELVEVPGQPGAPHMVPRFRLLTEGE
jgi:hypothetical protein